MRVNSGCATAGCDGYIAKPFRYQELLDRVAAVLDQRPR